MTPGITQVSGQSTDESATQQENANGDPYREVCDKIYRLLTRKRSYYGCAEESPLSNALGVEEDGIEPWRYQLARINEKCRRLRGEAGNQDTLIIETLYDIAGHAAVGIACIHAKKGKKNEL